MDAAPAGRLQVRGGERAGNSTLPAGWTSASPEQSARLRGDSAPTPFGGGEATRARDGPADLNRVPMRRRRTQPRQAGGGSRRLLSASRP